MANILGVKKRDSHFSESTKFSVTTNGFFEMFKRRTKNNDHFLLILRHENMDFVFGLQVLKIYGFHGPVF